MKSSTKSERSVSSLYSAVQQTHWDTLMKSLCFLPFFLCCFALVGVAQQSVDLDELLQEGAAFNRQSDYTRAIPLLRQAINLAPQDPTANYLLGVALLQSGHPADAVAPLHIAAQAPSGNDAAAGYLGDAEMEVKEYALAAEAFLSAVSRSPESEQTLVWWTDFSLERYRVLELSLRNTTRGRAAMLVIAAESVNLEVKQKEALLEQAAELDSSLPEIRGKLGIAQALLGEQSEAEASIKAARQNAPNAISTVELEALVAAARGNWDEANGKLLDLDRRSQAEFKAMLAAWPKNLLPGVKNNDPLWKCLRNSRADCAAIRAQPGADETASSPRLFAEGRWEQLIAAPVPPVNDIAAWFWRGMALARTGDCTHAIPALERGLKAGAEMDAAQLASCYQCEAIQSADRLQALGRDAAVHLIRGDILLSIRLDPAKAVDEYLEALRLRPNDPQLLEKLAEAYFSQGEMEKARQTAQQALALNPNREQLLRLLTQACMSERDYAAALSLLHRLAAIEPGDQWIGVQQATAYAQTSRPAEAVQALQPVLDRGYPDEKGSLHAMLAAQLRKLGRTEDASRATAQAIRLADAFAQQNENAPALAPQH
jgi:tetratricopeptide (TPR) repeat protein